MENLMLARIDDRLIHGQVMTAWMKVKPAKQIIVIDDKVAKDSFMIDVIELAAPVGVKVSVLTCDAAVAELKKGLEIWLWPALDLAHQDQCLFVWYLNCFHHFNSILITIFSCYLLKVAARISKTIINNFKKVFWFRFYLKINILKQKA